MMFGSPHVNESFEITAFGAFWLGIEWFFFNYTGHLKHKFAQSSSESSKQIRISIIIVLKCLLITCPSSDSFLGQIFIKLFQLRIHNSELLPRNRGRSPPRAGARGRDGQAAKHLPHTRRSRFRFVTRDDVPNSFRAPESQSTPWKIQYGTQKITWSEKEKNEPKLPFCSKCVGIFHQSESSWLPVKFGVFAGGVFFPFSRGGEVCPNCHGFLMILEGRDLFGTYGNLKEGGSIHKNPEENPWFPR